MLVLGVSHGFCGDLQSLRPRPKAAYSKPDSCILTSATPLIIPDSPSVVTARAIWLLQRYINEAIGDTLVTVSARAYSGDSGIFIGELPSNLALARYLPSVRIDREALPDSMGYVIDIGPRRILLCGADPDGTWNGVSTLRQLFVRRNGSALVMGAHIWDRPDFPLRWSSRSIGLNVPLMMNFLRIIADTMAAYKLNGLVDIDSLYELLPGLTGPPLDSLRAWRSVLAQRNIASIPYVANVSNTSGVIGIDPDLAAGVPYRNLFVMRHDGTALPVQDSVVSVANGGFESVDTSGFARWSGYSGWGTTVFADTQTVHSGKVSARCTKFHSSNAAGNCEFHQTLRCNPFHQYRILAHFRTSAFGTGKVVVSATGTDSTAHQTQVAFSSLKPASTNTSWDSIVVLFNSANASQLDIAVGVRGGTSGTVWFDDISMIDTPVYTRPLHRKGTPIHIRNHHTGIEYRETADLNLSNYLKPSSSNINEGDTLDISFYYSLPYTSAHNSNYSATPAMSEDTLANILQRQAALTSEYFHPDRYFLNYSDLRVMNWDSLDKSRNTTPAVLLGASITTADSLFRTVDGSPQNLMWSDMIDTFQFCQDYYQLLNGKLRGLWKLIPKTLTLVNYYNLATAGSFRFLSNMGFHQLYTCTADSLFTTMPSPFKAWRVLADSIPFMDGAIYLTTKHNYQWLPAFADYLWGTAPAVMHTPLRRLDLTMPKLDIYALAFRDPWDTFDSVTDVNFAYYDTNGILINSLSLDRIGNTDRFYAPLLNSFPHGLRYKMLSKNKQGLIHEGPMYTLLPPTPTLQAVTLTGPTDGFMDSATSAHLRWDTITGATEYRVQISYTSTFASPVVDAFVSADTMIFSSLVHDSTYYWRVSAANDSETGPWSSARRFYSAYIPPAVVLLSPANNTSDTVTSFVLRWKPAHSTPAVSAYYIQTGTDSMLANSTKSIVSGAPITIPAQAGWTYWRVAAMNDLGTGPWSDLWRFRHECIAQAPPLVAPADNTTNVSDPVVLRWSNDLCGNTFDVLLSTNSSFTDTVVLHHDISRNGDTIVGALLPLTRYYWKVRSKMEVTTSEWSPSFSFVTGAEAVSAEPSSSTEFLLQPNPASSTIRILAASSHRIDAITLLDSKGAIVRRLEAQTQIDEHTAVSLPLGGLSAGMYTVLIHTDGVVVRKNLVIE